MGGGLFGTPLYLNRRRFKTGHLKVSQIKFVGHDSKE